MTNFEFIPYRISVAIQMHIHTINCLRCGRISHVWLGPPGCRCPELEAQERLAEEYFERKRERRQRGTTFIDCTFEPGTAGVVA